MPLAFQIPAFDRHLLVSPGYGEEPTTEKDVPNDGDAVFLSAGPPSATPEASTPETAFLDADRDAIAAMPVVVLKNFAVKGSKNEVRRCDPSSSCDFPFTQI